MNITRALILCAVVVTSGAKADEILLSCMLRQPANLDGAFAIEIHFDEAAQTVRMNENETLKAVVSKLSIIFEKKLKPDVTSTQINRLSGDITVTRKKDGAVLLLGSCVKTDVTERAF